MVNSRAALLAAAATLAAGAAFAEPSFEENTIKPVLIEFQQRGGQRGGEGHDRRPPQGGGQERGGQRGGRGDDHNRDGGRDGRQGGGRGDDHNRDGGRDGRGGRNDGDRGRNDGRRDGDRDGDRGRRDGDRDGRRDGDRDGRRDGDRDGDRGRNDGRRDGGGVRPGEPRREHREGEHRQGEHHDYVVPRLGHRPLHDWDYYRGHRGWGHHYSWRFDLYFRPYWPGWDTPWPGYGATYQCLNYYNEREGRCQQACELENNDCVSDCRAYGGGPGCVNTCDQVDWDCADSCVDQAIRLRQTCY